jgi:3-oxoadipate enol-lactonase
MVNSLATSTDLWAAQASALAGKWRVVRYDARGHGRSDVPEGDYTLDRLGLDALVVLDAAGASRAHVCGISLGGMTAMWLGINAPDRVGRLVMANTGARIGSLDLWEQRLDDVRQKGMAAVAAGSMRRWFTADFRTRQPETVERFRGMAASCPVGGYAGCAAALRDADLRPVLARIAAPTMVIVGAHDISTTPEDGEIVRQGIPGARLLTLDSAHLSNVERAEEFTSAVAAFLTEE